MAALKFRVLTSTGASVTVTATDAATADRLVREMHARGRKDAAGRPIGTPETIRAVKP